MGLEETIRVLSEFSMILFFGFFLLDQIFIQFFLRRKTRAVDAGQHFIFCSPPIRSGRREKLEVSEFL